MLRSLRDVADAVLSVAKHLPKVRDVKAEAAFLHGNALPDQLRQIAFADDLVGARLQCHQNVKSPRAQSDRRAVPCGQPLACSQAERTER